jgi:cytosine/adenosine deaminase-related metal-dependent hydrolase
MPGDCPPRTLKARYIFPASAPPIADGTVTIAGEQIVAVGESPQAGEVEDLGNVALLPGLVNAHTHLELSDLASPIGGPGIGFVDWIERVIDARRRTAASERASSLQRGLAECLRLGTTAIGEIAQPGWDTQPFAAAGLDAIIFLELLAPTAPRVPAAVELAFQHLGAVPPAAHCRLGLSPHAPYSVCQELLDHLVALAAERHVPVAMHLAESREELELLRRGTGPWRDFLEARNAWDPSVWRRGARPLDYLRTLTSAPRALVIHGNYLDEEEIALLAEHRRRMAVVYCPRTHAYFGHDPYPLAEMLAARVTVALGTDSRASSPDLSILAEMRFAARQHPGVSPPAVLRLGTLAAAQALGRDRDLGSLEPGKLADLAVVALPDRDSRDPHELLFNSELPVVATWRSGERRTRNEE